MTERFWECEDTSRLDNTVATMIDTNVRVALKWALTDPNAMYAYFPIIFSQLDEMSNRKLPNNPLTLRICIDGINAKKDIPLDRIILKDSEFCAEDGSYQVGLEKLSIALHKLLVSVDEFIEEGRTHAD